MNRWRSVRVVYGADLESLSPVKGTGGSNPPFSYFSFFNFLNTILAVKK